jgi:hypothetical protein
MKQSDAHLRLNRLPLALVLVLAGALFTTAPALAAHATTTAVSSGTVIDNLTIVDPRNGKLQRGMAVVIDGGKIVKVVRAHSVVISGTAQLVDAGGKFVVPGYLDMHAHPLNSSSPETSLPLMLASGITGFRQMVGSPEQLEKRRQGQSLTPTVSPELLLIPGPVLAGPAVAAPEAVIAEIRKQKAAGADFIKIIDVPPATYLAALDEARADGLTVAGHLVPTVDVRDAARHGMRAIEHLGPTISMLLACSTDEVAIRKAMANAPPPPVRIAFNLPPAALKRLTANPVLLTDQAGMALIQHVVATYSEAKCRELAKLLIQSGTWQVPTLVRLEAMNHGDDDELRNNPDLGLMPADDRQMWKDVGDNFEKKFSAADKQTLSDLYALQLKLFKLFDSVGMPMLTGTDFGGQWLVPGKSLHREFDVMGKTGVSPLHVLQMTTINGAKFLGRESSMGTVEAGKDANLVILDADPLMSVQNLHKIYGVVRAGTYYSRAALDAITQQAEKAL